MTSTLPAAPPFEPFDDGPGRARSGLSRGAKIAIAIVVVSVLAIVAGIVALAMWVRADAEQANRLVPLNASVGQCVAVIGDQESSVAVGGDVGVIVGCDRAHSYEVYVEFEWTAANGYPGVFERIGDEGGRCERALEAYTGSSYWDSRFDYEVVVGSRAQWDAGNRSARCVLYDPFDNNLIGSARNSRQ